MDNRYKERIERVLRYIDENLHQSISLRDAARISHFSEYHFHRIFSGVMQETLNDYIVRRRLETAVNTLVFENTLPITEVADRYGFSSSANFSKAVKNHFGFSPSDIRNPEKSKNSKIGKIFSKYGKDFNPSDLYPNRIVNRAINQTDTKGIKMNVKIKALEQRTVAMLTSEKGYETESIFATWDQIIDWASAHNIPQQEQNRFAFCYDNPAVTPLDKCRYDAAVVIDPAIKVNAPFRQSVIPAGKYATVYFKGEPGETKTQLSLYTEWLPDSGFEPDHFPMLEHYLNDVREDGYVEMEIHIKLKAL